MEFGSLAKMTMVERTFAKMEVIRDYWVDLKISDAGA